MKGRLAIAATLSALLATTGAALCALLAQWVGAPGLMSVVMVIGGGVVLGVMGVAAALAVPEVEIPPEIDVLPVPEPEPHESAEMDLGPLARELERLASTRSTEVQLTISDGTPRELVFALEQLADRLAEDQRKALSRESKLREAAGRHIDMSRRLSAELERQRDAVQVATRVRDAFLARMSHELRTPLNAILGYIELLEEEVEDEDLRKDLSRVRTNAMNLLAIVTTILDLTQLETNAFDIIPEAVDLKQLVRKVEASVQAEAEANGNDLRLHVPDGLHVRLDRRMLQSILYNLASNACKYTSNGTVTVDLVEVGDRVHLVVTDSGIGMTERQIEEAFRPFGQADESTTRRYDGAGLGLAVVRGFVEAMGGQLRIDSALGKGARVEVDLPMQCAPRSAGLSDDDPTMLVR